MASNKLLVHDLTIVLRGAKKVCAAAVDFQANRANKQWENSSLKPIGADSLSYVQQMVADTSEADLSRIAKETSGRISAVLTGLNAYITRDPSSKEVDHDFTTESGINKDTNYGDQSQSPFNIGENIISTDNAENIHSTEIHKFASNKNFPSIDFDKITDSFQMDDKTATVTDEEIDALNIKLSEVQSKLLNQNINIFENAANPKEDNEIPENVDNSPKYDILYQEPIAINESKTISFIEKTQISDKTPPGPQTPVLIGRKPITNKVKSTLSADAKARKVPHSQLGRFMTFSRLGAGLAVGTMAEMTRRTFGGKDATSTSLSDSSPFLNEANAMRIVDTLCKVRGAALKIGQMLSLTDDTFINPTLQKIFERVRHSADFMPTWQLKRTLESSLGSEWQSLVASFDEKPFAAASIGQVHQAILHDGRAVAMKIQYPGVADGIESDINNLVSTLKIANVFPKGLYVDSAIKVAKKELRWECDYHREKACTLRYKKLLQPYDEYYVPDVIDELCTDSIFTTELIEGVAVDKCVDMDQPTRDRICTLIMKLCILEVFQFGFMQTDPNWANFFYNADTKQIALLDFGACRDYKKEFVDDYINVIHGAAKKDSQKVLEHSQKLSFLTGHEAKIMEKAHVDAVMILGEAFQNDEPFDFANQYVTQRIQNLIPVMLDHRMCPPPEESYSLHRKMSGVFLLCAKLRGKIQCKSYFDDIYANYKFGGDW